MAMASGNYNSRYPQNKIGSLVSKYVAEQKLGLRWTISNCEARGKGRAKGRPRKVTQRSFIDYRWWMVDGGYPFPDALL